MRHLVAGSHNKLLLIDTNLFLLFLIGTYEARWIPLFKRTQKYTTTDFEKLLRFSSSFRGNLTTPHILTEVSNLAFPLNAREESRLFVHLRALIERMQERLVPSAHTVQSEIFPSFGLADASIVEAAQYAVVLTDDYALAGTIRNLGHEAVHLKELH